MSKKGKISNTIIDYYKPFKKEHKNVDVSYEDFIMINKEYNKYLLERVFNGEHCSLPGSATGSAYIRGKKENISVDENGKIKGLAPDWKATNALWKSDAKAKEQKKIIYHQNLDTNGVRYKFFWDRTTIISEYLQFFSFRLSRANKKILSKSILDNKEITENYIIKGR